MPVVDLSIDSSGAINGLGKYDSAVQATQRQTETSFNKIRTSANNLGVAVGVALAAGAVAIGSLGLKAIEAASDMEETQGKFDVVFRDLGDYAEDSAARIAASYGMSKRNSKLYLSSLQDLLVPAGLARDKAAQMSVAFTELAADLGSFNNVPTAQVVRDIQSALAGGSETMTKYGIDVKVGAINAEILRQGLDTSTKAAERQSRVIALLAIAQRDSSDAMGDFSRTQTSFANQTKIAKAQIDDMVVAIGEKLLPFATQAITKFNEWITTNGRLEQILKGLVSTVQFLHNGFNGIVLVAHGIIVAFSAIAETFSLTLIPLELLLTGMQKLGLIDTNPIANLREEIALFGSSARDAFTEHLEKLEETNGKYEDLKLQIDGVGTAHESASAKAVTAIDNSAEAILRKSALLEDQKEIIEMVGDAETDAAAMAAYHNKKATEDAAAWAQRQADLKTKTEELKTEETALATEVANVTTNADASTTALQKQVVQANAVATAVGKIADANQRTSATAEGTYEASKAWSGGSSSMGSAPALTQAETDYINSRTAIGAAGSVNSKLSSFVTSNDRDRWASMDSLQLSSRANALEDVYAARDANGGAPVTSIMNIFNQNVTSSDVTNIIEEQQRQAART